MLNVGSVGYTQMSPMKTLKFIKNKKKMFADNWHHKQTDYIYGTKSLNAYDKQGVSRYSGQSSNDFSVMLVLTVAINVTASGAEHS